MSSPISGGAKRGGVKGHKKQYKHGLTGLLKKEREEVMAAHEGGVVKTAQSAVTDVMHAVKEYKADEMGASQEDAMRAKREEQKVVYLSKSNPALSGTNKVATSVVKTLSSAITKLEEGKPAGSPLRASSSGAKEVYATAIEEKTGNIIGHSKAAKHRRAMHREKRRSNSPAKKGKKSSPKKDGSSKRGPRSPSTYNMFVKQWFENHPGKNVRDHASDMGRDWKAMKAMMSDE